MTPEERQLRLEEESDEAASKEALAKLQEDTRKGRGTPKTRAMVAGAFPQVEEAIEAEKKKGGPGRAGKTRGWLRELPTDVAAAIALQYIVSILLSTDGRSATVSVLSKGIGRRYEVEVRKGEIARASPYFLQRVEESIKDRTYQADYSYMRRLTKRLYSIVLDGQKMEELDRGDLIRLGSIGLQAVKETGMVYIYHGGYKTRDQKCVALDPQVEDFLTSLSSSDVSRVIDKTKGAMVCEPQPWTDVTDGGYLTLRRKTSSPLLDIHKLRPEAREAALEGITAENMPEVFSAANYLQSIPYQSNDFIQSTLMNLWSEGGGALGVPTRTGPVKPAWPFPDGFNPRENGTEKDMEAFQQWKDEMKDYYEKRGIWKGHVHGITGIFRSMHHVGSSNMWFPVFMDTRGRWYYRGMVSPQGDDASKAVLQFGTAKTLGDRGLFWLRVMVANNFGYDKTSLRDRASWTREHWPEIEKALENPVDYPEVWGDDEPWNMMAAAKELKDALDSGDPQNYRSSYIVHQDASCSGLQHASALMRDKLGGKFVNLVDSGDNKADIYQKVIDEATKAMRKDKDSQEDEGIYARHWLNVGIPRALGKKPIMTYTYNATLRGTAIYIENYARLEDPSLCPPQHTLRYAYYLARKLFEGIANTVPKAAELKEWLSDLPKQADRTTYLRWVVPSGFTVLHDYQGIKKRRVSLYSCGAGTVQIKEATGGTDLKSSRNALVPNLVHSLDACHMTMVANRCKQEGIHLAGVHDSFGTHPADADRLGEIIREEFVRMYAEHDILQDLLTSVGVDKEIPEKGTLDINEVLKSSFFVS